jgi:hypothetical protein
LLRCAGSTHVAAWCRTWGSLRWESARAWELPPSARGGPSRSAFTPFEGLILSDSRTASLRPLPPCRSPLPARLRGLAPSTSPGTRSPLPMTRTPDPSLGSAPLRGHDFIAGGRGLPRLRSRLRFEPGAVYPLGRVAFRERNTDLLGVFRRQRP